jgi:hypothetical protein
MRSSVALAALLAVSLPLTVQAGEPRSHDGGFFMRLAPGIGYTSSKIEDGSNSLEIRGASGSFDIALGAVISRNFAIHAVLGGWSLSNPTVEFNGLERDTDDASLTMGSFGAGFTYYFGSSNTYLTASAGASSLTLDNDGDKTESDTGFSFDAGLGKEWWVSDRWGLGVSATIGYHSIPTDDEGIDDNFKGPSFAVRFSATLN